ncbi:MAG: SCO family protein [Proteobacteria bacterium]|nr:SCO family protein [Pseudomonadota bacterium]
MKLIGLLALFLAFAAPAHAAELPGDSVYRLPVALTDQNEHTFQLADRAGKPLLASMFYTSCQTMCPLIIESLKRTQKAIAHDADAKPDVLLVSFDAQRDTPAHLRQVLGQRKLDAATWTLAHADAAGVRQIAAVLDIQYRALPDGDFNHTSVLVLLDAQGRIVARSEKMDGVDTAFVAAAKKLFAAK